MDTGGETEVFAVASLTGVAALPNLEQLDLDGHGHCDGGHDLTPLSGHPALKELTVFTISGGAKELLNLPALSKFRHANGLPDEISSELRARGVDIA